VEHERNVFEDDPGYATLIQKTEDMTDETGPFACYACGEAGLTQILARESSDEQFNIVWKILQIGYVGFARNVGKSGFEDRTRWFPYFAEHRRFVAAGHQPTLQPPDPSEQPGDSHRSPLGVYPHAVATAILN